MPTIQLELIRGMEFPSTQIPPASLLIGAEPKTMTLNEICGELSSEQAIAAPGAARKLHDSMASMSQEVLAYKGLLPAREPLLAWLARRAA